MGSRYSSMKIFRFRDKIDSLPLKDGPVLAPVHVRLKPTNVCNHHCHYCAYRSRDLQLGKDMRLTDSIPRERMLEICDDLVAMGVRAVTFSGGGEPFCYPHLAEAMHRLTDGGLRIASLTNGGRLKGEAAEVLARRGTWVRVSIDGWDGPSYAQFRGVGEDEFDTVLGNIEAFKRFGGPCVLGVNCIVGKENSHHLVNLARKVRDVGADSFKVSPRIVSNEGSETNAYHRPFFSAVREQIERIRQELAGPDFELYDSYHELENDFSKGYHWCPYLQVLPVIGADLNVYSCQDKAYNLDCGLLGSLRDQSFRDFWMNGKDKFFAMDPARDCAHHCVADAKNRMLLEYLGADPDHFSFV